MTNTFAKNKYDQLYKSLGFERSELFELIKKTFNPKTVIYPGCSIHITPSFYFNHIIYIDKSQPSLNFFSDDHTVKDLINKNKTYKEAAYWKFIPSDVKNNLGLKLASYDLLLSLFAGKMIEYCEQYIKPGGIILTGSFFSDNESIKEKETFKLIGLIKRKNKKYILSHNFAKPQQSKSRLKQKNNTLEYIDNECYYLYQKISHQKN